nr:hypothetical protein [Brucella anthropi]
MDKVKKIESQYYYSKRKALTDNEPWDISFKEWLSYAIDSKALDDLTRPNSGKKIVRRSDSKPWQVGNLCMIAKRVGRASRNPVEMRGDTEYTTLTVPQWVSALEANKAHQHK